MHIFTRIQILFFGLEFIVFLVSATVLPCAENRTELCIQNLATFITLDLPKFANEAELERLCRAAEDGQKCSSDFLRSSTCVNSDEQLLISLQVGRSVDVSKMLCSSGGYITDPAFRKLYLKHSPCIDEHQKKIKDCYVSAGIVEDPELEIVRNSTKSTQEKHSDTCCPMVQYIECSENAIETSCGLESKGVVLKILVKVAGKQLEEFCTGVDPKFPNSPAACANSAVERLISLSLYSVLISITFLFNVLF